MATTIASTIVSRASTLLQDTTNIRWPADELLLWLNDGQREIALYKPNAYAKNISQALVAGTKQTLPADALELISVVRNMGVNGTTPGNAVRIVSREIMDAQIAGWHTATADANVKHYMYSLLNPKTFYVYPPQPVTPGQVEIIYGASPADVAAGAVILVDDIYVSAIVDYIMYRAYSKDTEYAANANLAGAYYTAFTSKLGGKAAGETQTNPNSGAAGNRNVV